MLNISLDSAVKAAAEKLKESDLAVAETQTKVEIEGRAWNMNQPLNMIAYEDQR